MNKGKEAEKKDAEIEHHRKELIEELQSGNIKEFCIVYKIDGEPYQRRTWKNAFELAGVMMSVINDDILYDIWDNDDDEA